MATIGLKAPCWAIFRDALTIATGGNDSPKAPTLASALSMLGPSELEKLDAFIQKHPDHQEARRLRFKLLQGRLPQKAFEARLAEDAALAELAFDFSPADPRIQEPELWKIKAKRTLPNVEAALQRWPSNTGLWRSWIAWNTFREKPLLIPDFAESLTVYGPRNAFISRLPTSVHEAVIRQCRERKRPDAMRDWFDAAFQGLRPFFFAGEAQNQMESEQKQEKVIHDGMVEALNTLGRKAELADFEKAWQQRLRGISLPK
jgi:hypothetical protein